MTRKKSLQRAVSDHVSDGDSVALGVNLEQMIPFATAHEIIRQEIRDLTVISPTASILVDQLARTGSMSKFIGAGLNSISTNGEHSYFPSYTDSFEGVGVEPHTMLTLALGLKAGATGSSFLPVSSSIQKKQLEPNPNIAPFTDPISEEESLAVSSIKPDLTVLHVQRSDVHGNAQIWGLPGVAQDAINASSKILVIAEEIVDPEIISSDPNRTVVSRADVCAVVEEPWGGHPSPVQGYYQSDRSFYEKYLDNTETESGFNNWAEKWIYNVEDRSNYLQVLGQGQLAELTIKNPSPSIPVDFGY